MSDLISREALRKAFHERIYYFNKSSWDEANAIIDDAPTVDMNTKLSVAYLKGRRQGQSEERPQCEWIPITENLPNTLGVYNVTRKLKEGETIYFISTSSYFDGQNTWYADTGINHSRPYLTDITAWQPLPEPYKKGGEEE